MAEATTTIEHIDLSNIEELVTADQIARITASRNCLVHVMDPLDIVCVLWKMISQLPMMQMHRMYNTEEIFQTSWAHLQKAGRGVLEPLKDGKQKMILCPVHLPLKRTFPRRRLVLPSKNKYMEPLRRGEEITDKGVLEQYVLVDRDACFYVLEGFWETKAEMSFRLSGEYAGYRQLNGVSLRGITSADELYSTLRGNDMVAFFHHAMTYLQKVLGASLESTRRDYEKSVGVAGEGDQAKYEKYLAMVRATNLFYQVREQMHHRYGC